MDTIVDDNPTREKIILSIKKTGGMTVDELSRQVGITPMGVRQHLISLEKKGVLTYDVRKHGIGRPVFLYRLTDKAEDLFPKAYSGFLMSMLSIVEETGGRARLSEIFRIWKNRLAAEYKETLAPAATTREKLALLSQAMTKQGYLAEFTEEDGRFLLNVFNCALANVSRRYGEVCDNELDLFRGLFGKGVSRQSCYSQGDATCMFLIPKS